MEAKPNSVLIVDDATANIVALVHILERDYTVYAEKDGKRCVETIKNLRPDLILLDVTMPEISGFDIIKRLKTSENTKDIPVLFVTGNDSPEDEVRGFELGAADYIRKPFSASVIKTRIRHQMQIINQQRRLESLQKAQEKERKQNEQARINKRVQLVIESSPMSIEIYDTEGIMLDCNRGTIDMHGFDDKEAFLAMYNRAPDTFYPVTQPCGTPSLGLMASYFEDAALHGTAQFEWNHRTYKGEDFPTKVNLARIEHEGTFMLVAHVHDLREIKRLENARLYAAEEGSRAKSRFLARMSHEIRTPISAVMGITEIQLRRNDMPPITEEAFIKIYDSSKMLLSIVNDILDLSRIESGEMELKCNPYDFAYIISDAAQLHLLYLERKRVLFNMTIDPNIPTVLVGDALRIKQIINNLLTNAFKYTEDGTVTMSVTCEPEEDGRTTLRVNIQDTGRGMTPTQLKEAQKEYVRVNEHDFHATGAGLGIPIVSSITQLMGADFHIQSEVGKGTVTTVSIPQGIGGPDVLGPDMAHRLEDFEQVAWSSRQEFAFVPEQMPYGKVLVVDDVDTNLYVAEAMLEAFGLTVELAEGGQAALDKIAQGQVYDIIFLDHMMPDIDGMEVAQQLRKSGYNHPIVALTANAIIGQAELFMQNGFSGFMSKPIDIKILNSFLVRYVKGKG